MIGAKRYTQKTLFIGILLLISNAVFSQSPSAGTYPIDTLNIGENAVIQASQAPSAYDYLTVTSSTLPARRLVIDQTTGAIRITNPQLPGTHIIKVIAGNATEFATSEFELQVYRETMPELCNPLFYDAGPTFSDTVFESFGYGVNMQVLDFNNDGMQDYIYQNRDTRLVLMLANENGGYQKIITEYLSGYDIYDQNTQTPKPQKIADVNNDGNPDILMLSKSIADPNKRYLLTLLGDGDNSLITYTDSILIDIEATDSTQLRTHHFALNDLNNDGNTDLVITESENQMLINPNTGDFYEFPKVRTKVRLFLGQGDGGFSPWQEVIFEGPPNENTISSSSLYKVYDIQFADIDQDGDIDIALFSNSFFVSTLLLEDFGTLPLTDLNLVNASFGASSGINTLEAELTDFNHDGYPDFILRTPISFASQPSLLFIYLGNGDGSFSFDQSVNPLNDTGNNFVKLADFNQDNEVDILVSEIFDLGEINGIDTYSSRITISYGSAEGIFSELTSLLETDGRIADFAIVDLNQDMGSDILIIKESPISSGPWGQKVQSQQVFYSNNTSIEVSGKNNAIASGDETPDTEDGTDFAAVGINSTLTRSFSISNTGTIPLIIPKDSIYLQNELTDFFLVDSVLIEADSAFYQVFPLVVFPGTSELIRVSFSPTALGTQLNTLHIKSSACNIKDYNFSLSATGATPSLGIYEATIVQAGSSVVIAPNGGVPYGAIQAASTTDFKGILTVDNESGELRVSNPVLAGIYEITLYAFEESLEYEDTGTLIPGFTEVRTLVLSDMTTFPLTVLPQECSNGLFSPGDTVYTNINSHGVHIADFNRDGDLDFINPYSVTIPFPDPDDFPALPDLNGASVRLNNGDGTYQGPNLLSENDSLLELIVGYSPRSVAVADYDGNGIQDIAIANSDPVGNVFIRGGIGNGMFALPDLLGSGIVPLTAAFSKSIKTGDFNNDGFPDLVIVNYGISNPFTVPFSSVVTVLFGDGMLGFRNTPTDGTVSLPPVINVVGNNSGDLVVGDFNNDGEQDYATASYDEDKISIRLGDSSGYFESVSDVSTYVGDNPSSIALGDFNGDGNQDLVTTSQSQNTVSVKLGNGDGSFMDDIDRTYAAGGEPADVSVADFNGDGNQDLAVANELDNTISIYLGDGQGAFTLNDIIPTASGPVSIDVGDMNNDGYLDLAVSASNSGFVQLIYGDAPVIGTLAASGNGQAIISGSVEAGAENHTVFDTTAIDRTKSRIYTLSNTSGVAILLDEASITFDGADNELFDLGDTAFPILIESGGSYELEVLFSPLSIGTSVVVLNVDNVVCDNPVHYMDFTIEATAVLPATLGVYPDTETLAGGGGIIIPDAAPGLTTRMTAMSESNLFDGILSVDPATGDVVVSKTGNPGTYTIYVYAFNQFDISTVSSFELTVTDQACSIGAFERSSYQIDSENNIANEVVVGDINGDGFSDMVILSGNEGNTGFSQLVYLGTEEPSVFTILENSEDEQAISIALVDFNGDGLQDMVKLYPGSESIAVELGAGDGSFSLHATFESGPEPHSLFTGDIDADGNTDLVIANKVFATPISILRGDGLGNFSSHEAPTLSGAANIELGDFNQDGYIDILAFMADALLLLEGDGSGDFNNTVSSPLEEPSSPFSFFSTSNIESTTGDFNGDQVPDIAYSNDDRAWIHLGLGNGSFDTGFDFDSNNGTDELLSGDFNGDGFLDIAMASLSSFSFIRGIQLYMGLGDGNFTFGKRLTSEQYNSGGLASADFNKDGRMDLTASLSELGVSIYSNASAISVQSFIEEATVVIDNDDYSPAISNKTDFGGVCVGTVLKNLYFIRNNTNTDVVFNEADFSISGNGSDQFIIGDIAFPVSLGPDLLLSFTLTFAPSAEGIKEAIVSIASGDCLDSDYDFAIQGLGETIDPLTQAVMGTYSQSSVVSGQNLTLSPDNAPTNTVAMHAVALPVFNGSFAVDLISGNVQLSNADQPGVYEVTVYAVGESVCDLAMTTFPLEVLAPECSNSSFVEMQSLHPGENTTTGLWAGFKNMVVGDFNNDTYLDLLGTLYSESSALLYFGAADASFQDSVSIILGESPNELLTADFNGDGNLDIAIAYGLAVDKTLSIELGDGLGNFTQSYVSEVQSFIGGIAVGDLNSDGIPDLIVNGSTDVDGLATYGNKVLFGDGQGGISKTNVIDLDFQPGTFVLGDLNQDGFLDGVINDRASDAIQVFLGDGTGSLSESVLLDVFSNPRFIELSDLDTDGDIDIVTGGGTTGNSGITIYLANGDGTYASTEDLGPFYSIVSMDVSDYSGDGLPDILIENGFEGEILVITGNGDGNFMDASSSQKSGLSTSLVTADFNNDSIMDLAFADQYVNKVALYKGIECGATLSVDPATASEEIVFSLYPNPTESFATVKWTEKARIEKLNLSVYDMIGRKVREYPNIQSFEGVNTFELDMKGTVPGTYVLKIEMDDKVSSKLFIKVD